MFNFSLKLLITRTILIFIIFFIIFFDKNLILTFFNNNENQILNLIKSFILENSLNLNKLYNFPLNLTTILLINYLFLTLIVVVKITNIFEGPLRSK